MNFMQFLPSLISAAGSIGGGVLSSQGNKETPIQKQKRNLINDLMASLKGGGQYADLYNMDDQAFQKSYVDPAKARFQNQIAPQIQQQYLATGQQGSSGLDDQLLRAGVDLDQLLNEQYGNFYQNAQNRRQNTISSILGSGEGVARNSPMQNLAQSSGGYLASDSFSKGVSDIFRRPSNAMENQMNNPPPIPTRKGFSPDWNSYLAMQNQGY